MRSPPGRANAVPNDVAGCHRIGTRRQDRTRGRNGARQRAMSVGSDSADSRPTIVELIGQQERFCRASLIDLLVGRRGGATEKDLVARRAGTWLPCNGPLGAARRLVATRQRRWWRRSVRQRPHDRCIEPRYVRDVAEVDVRKVVGRQMLALVILESLREAKTRVAEAHEGAVISAT